MRLQFIPKLIFNYQIYYYVEFETQFIIFMDLLDFADFVYVDFAILGHSLVHHVHLFEMVVVSLVIHRDRRLLKVMDHQPERCEMLLSTRYVLSSDTWICPTN